MSDQAITRGAHHIGLTVPDLATTRTFFICVLEFEQVGESPDAEALGALHRKLQRIDGVEIEFAPEQLGGGSTQHMMCTIPGGIRTEFIALPA